jgi:arylsulfatase A-like enzyme
MKRRRRSGLAPACLALLLLARGAGTGGAAARTGSALPTRPNLVLILTDDLDLDLHSLDYMPHLKALMTDQGTTFSNYFVPVSLCCPSRATILLGQYSHSHHIYSNFPPDGGFQLFQQYDLDRATIATALQASGYRTVLMGKYLNGYPKTESPTYIPPGWSEWYVPANNDAYGGFNFQLNENGKLVTYGASPGDYMTDVLAAKAADVIHRSQGGSQPFFLYIATFAPHKPATPAPRHQNLFPGLQAPRPPSFDETAQTLRGKPQQYRDVPPLTPGDVAQIDALYRRRIQSLQAVDELVVRVVRELRRSGQLDRTYLVFTSDNGLHMGEHRFRPGKYTSYEEDIHVPLILRGPGIPAGRVRDDLASSVDLAPTFADLAGATLAEKPDGRSLVPLFASGPAPAGWRRMVLLEQRPFPPPGSPSPGPGGDPGDEDSTAGSRQGHAGVLEPRDPGDRAGLGSWPPVTFRGVRTKTYKYVEYASGERDYYDLASDPYELHNRIPGISPAKLARLAGLLKGLDDCRGEACRAAEARVPPAP